MVSKTFVDLQSQTTYRMTKKVEVVMNNNGENCGTYSVLCFLSSFTGDINEQVERFVSWDCNILVPTNRYKVVTITMPEWMSEKYFVSNDIAYKFAVALGGDYVLTLNENAMSKFFTLSETYQYFIGEYMKGNTKNSFKLSIREKITDWLNSDCRKYAVPLSTNQFQAATRYVQLYVAKQISNHVYWS